MSLDNQVNDRDRAELHKMPSSRNVILGRVWISKRSKMIKSLRPKGRNNQVSSNFGTCSRELWGIELQVIHFLRKHTQFLHCL